MTKYDAFRVETLKYLDLSKNKWRNVEVRQTRGHSMLDSLAGGCGRYRAGKPLSVT